MAGNGPARNERNGPELVRAALRRGVPLSRLARETGLKPKHVQGIITRLRQSGEEIPYSQRQRSRAERARLSAALKGRPRSIELVIKASTVSLALRPLVLRNLLPSEILELTDFTKNQVKGALRRNRRLLPPDYFSPDKMAARASRSKARAHRKAAGKLDQERLRLARELVAKDMFSEETAVWDLVKETCEENGEDWFDDSATALVLEVLAIAVLRNLRGKSRMIERLNALGQESAPIWFESNEMEQAKAKISAAVRSKLFGSSGPH